MLSEQCTKLVGHLVTLEGWAHECCTRCLLLPSAGLRMSFSSTCWLHPLLQTFQETNRNQKECLLSPRGPHHPIPGPESYLQCLVQECMVPSALPLCILANECWMLHTVRLWHYVKLDCIRIYFVNSFVSIYNLLSSTPAFSWLIILEYFHLFLSYHSAYKYFYYK